ncbi:helix-turn-helix transcriptional regulator [Nocardia sp. NPDC051787]|uniref:helix-turn-helix transcriptional regulator n=1 Tax=Nocardia sp. NPDC051787 TaxID=3155415 RepID=UPI003445A20F
MASDNLLGEFLRARRALTRPSDFGLPEPIRRRSPGLRREEVALLVGVSVDYYVRLEQGRDRNPSQQVLNALARVFQLDDEATAHLYELARPEPRRRRAGNRRPEKVGPGLLRLLDCWPHTPAIVLGRHLDVLAGNLLASALAACHNAGQNAIQALFLDPGSRTTFPDWHTVAADTVASLRAAAGTDLDDPRLTDLVGELSLKSEEFRQLWARHDVRNRTTGTKRFVHPMVGELTLDFETFTVNSAPGQALVVYYAEPGSPSAHALGLLGSAVATDRQPELRQPQPKTTAPEAGAQQRTAANDQR